MLHTQTQAPAFSLKDQHNTTRTLEELKGKWSIVYFYPKDDTPGCTTEACAIRDIYNDYERLGVFVYGVSKDSPESHKAFAEKYELPFVLLSDPEGTMIKAYGAWGEKKLFGKQTEGILRVSYLIGPDLSVFRTYPKVDPASHALELLSDLKDLVT